MYNIAAISAKLQVITSKCPCRVFESASGNAFLSRFRPNVPKTQPSHRDLQFVCMFNFQTSSIQPSVGQSSGMQQRNIHLAQSMLVVALVFLACHGSNIALQIVNQVRFILFVGLCRPILDWIQMRGCPYESTVGPTLVDPCRRWCPMGQRHARQEATAGHGSKSVGLTQ